MGNSLLKSSEYKEMKKLTKKNTVINSSIPPISDEYKPESPTDKAVSFKSAVSVQHFDIEDGESFGEVVTEPVYDPYEDPPPSPTVPAPAGSRSPAASDRVAPAASPSSAPARQLKPTDSIVVARLKKNPADESASSSRTDSPLRGSVAKVAVNGRN